MRTLLRVTANRYQSKLLICSHCKARGSATWELADDGLRMQLVKIAGGFHIESGSTVPDLKMIVCNKCDQIHGEATATR